MVGASKVYASAADAIGDVKDGASIAIAGFGIGHRFPTSLIFALRDSGKRDLTIVCNSLGSVHEMRAQILAENRQIKRLIASFSARPGMRSPAEEQILAGTLELELVPQGILVERLRAAAAGLPAFYSPVGVGTEVAQGKEVRSFQGQDYVLEEALAVDFAFVRAHRADAMGNLVFRGGSQNFNKSFAKAASIAIAEADEIVEVGDIPPEQVDLPGIFVDRVVESAVRLSPADMTSGGRPQNPQAVRTYNGRPGLSRLQMAERASRLIPAGGFANLGVGIPTLVSNFAGTRDLRLHAENGILGYGSVIDATAADPDVYNAGGQFVSLRPGASFFDSVESFEIARSGRLDAVVLGAFQVDEHGSMANWSAPPMVGGGIGGAMDLVVPRNRVIVLMTHQDREGRPKLVHRCELPITAPRCVDVVLTDLALFERVEGRFLIRELAPGFSLDDVRQLTQMNFGVASDLSTMAFSDAGGDL